MLRWTIAFAVAAGCSAADPPEPAENINYVGVDSSAHGVMALPSTRRAEIGCFGAAGSVRLTNDSIGHIPLRATIGDIRSLCPAAADRLYYAYEEMGRALLYSDSGVEVQAQQYLGSEDATQPPLNEDAPPTQWRISGNRVVLGGDIPLSSSWNELTSRLTVADISGETSRLFVRFEEWPNLLVYLAEDVDVIYDRPREEWIAAIPGETRIDYVVVAIWP